MADNVAITAGSGTTVAADDVGGVLYQRVKTTWGPDGTANDADVATGKPLPVQLRSATGLIPGGEPTDAAASQTDTTSVSWTSLFKQISKSIQLMVFGAGTAAAAQRTTLASDDPAVATLGATNGGAVITDANGTIQQYLRGLVKLVIAKIGVTEADGDNATIGAKADTLYTGGVGSWSVVALLKGLYAQLIAATPAGANRIGKVGADANIVGGSFTRPADTTAYASGDLVANSVTAGSVVPITVTASLANDGVVAIPRVRLKKSGTSLTNAQFRVHLYKASPTCTNGDNGAWLTTESTYIGGFDITMDKAFSDGAKGNGAPLVGNFVIAEMAAGTMTIFALIEARAAYTPLSAEVFTLACEVLQFS